LQLRPQVQYEAVQQARREQELDDFKQTYRARAGVEGSFTQGNRRCDLRHARYIGQAKVHLQHLFTAIALNMIRLWRGWQDSPVRRHVSQRSRV
jgi:transposase